MDPAISGRTGLIAFFAHPCRHSKSPAMHNAAFRLLGLDYAYLAFDIDLPDLSAAIDAMRTLNIRGANLSMPNKEAVLPYLDELAPEAALAGAVNTIINEDGRLIGRNTDGAGWMRAVGELGVDLKGQHLTVVGTGGAAKAIISQAALDGVAGISVFNRKSPRWAQAEQFAAKVTQLTGCPVNLFELNTDRPDCVDTLHREIAASRLLCNATNVGMGALEEQCYLPDSSYFHPGLAVTDVIYSPKETKLLRLAREAGCQTQNGDLMVLYQGAVAFRHWTGQEMPVEAIKPIIGI